MDARSGECSAPSESQIIKQFLSCSSIAPFLLFPLRDTVRLHYQDSPSQSCILFLNCPLTEFVSPEGDVLSPIMGKPPQESEQENVAHIFLALKLKQRREIQWIS